MPSIDYLAGVASLQRVPTPSSSDGVHRLDAWRSLQRSGPAADFTNAHPYSSHTTSTTSSYISGVSKSRKKAQSTNTSTSRQRAARNSLVAPGGSAGPKRIQFYPLAIQQCLIASKSLCVVKAYTEGPAMASTEVRRTFAKEAYMQACLQCGIGK